MEVLRLDVGERVDLRELARFQRVVSLGSEHAADDGSVTWQAFEREALRAADAAGVPILGICFGGQSLAVALGGAVRRADRPEIGWVSVGVLDGADADPVAPLTDDGPWLEWHFDEILPPDGSEVLAHNASGVQAWRLGHHVGLQFHPEVDEAIVGAWIANNREEARVPPDLARRTAELAANARARAFALFDVLLLG